MVRVAIAGGSGGLGRVITKAIAQARKHDIFVLSRRSMSISEQIPGVGYLIIDYSNVSQITDLLESNNIEVVISAIGIVFEDSHRAQLNLIEGASHSTTVRRFAPSEFALDYVEGAARYVFFNPEQEYLITSFHARGYPFPVPGSQVYKAAEYKMETLEKLKSTQMEYTRFMSGFLVDYYGYPAAPYPYFHWQSSPVTLTHSETIGRFVAASLDLPCWPKKALIVGDTLTWNQALAIAEEVRGKTFDVKIEPLYDLKKGIITELPGNKRRYLALPKGILDAVLCVWNIGFIQGFYDLEGLANPDSMLNQVFPNIPVLSFKEFMERCWK
ncbi:nmra-like family protein [Colletotrichum kahawae]|uniref:Nmra-like family protein n=1 Tax=Colletotrichum kahawae TaxID=34407 RepID=A0AAD9YLM4_COLKA|nr:nmra-like family protein [Colletotrichum kahawae]